jgi:hypothetical protein
VGFPIGKEVAGPKSGYFLAIGARTEPGGERDDFSRGTASRPRHPKTAI